MYFSNDLELPEVDEADVDLEEQEHWINRQGQEVKLKNMSNSYLQNLIKFCRSRSGRLSTWSPREESERIEYLERFLKIFENELANRTQNPQSINSNTQSPKKSGRKLRPSIKKVLDRFDELPSSVLMRCGCSELYYARKADLKRGWGLSHSKRCAFKVKRGLISTARIVQFE